MTIEKDFHYLMKVANQMFDGGKAIDDAFADYRLKWMDPDAENQMQAAYDNDDYETGDQIFYNQLYSKKPSIPRLYPGDYAYTPGGRYIPKEMFASPAVVKGLDEGPGSYADYALPVGGLGAATGGIIGGYMGSNTGNVKNIAIKGGIGATVGGLGGALVGKLLHSGVKKVNEDALKEGENMARWEHFKATGDANVLSDEQLSAITRSK